MKTTAIFTTRTTLNEYLEGLTFASNGDGTCSVSGIGTCTDTDIKIPPVYNGEKVVRIGTLAFSDCSSLTSVTIPDSVAWIGSFAFDGCKGLVDITIPDSVDRIGYSAFSYCTNLTNITLPESVNVTSVNNSWFSCGTILMNITLPEGAIGIREHVLKNCPNLKNVAARNSVALAL